ncbi:hypothetical protein V9T40_000849 [Parthenolecanium corni]|uniref:Transcription initiation factor IIB n=1 Tax=Parthenolecanium corni TaxID=536013 RepID=A0AAN9TCE0_9HEMI
MDKVNCRYHPDAPLVEDYHAGDTICSECGLVVGDRVIDVSAEWRSFTNSEDRCRVGAHENLLLGGSDLSTIIGPATGGSSFDEFGLPKYYNRNTMTSSDRTLICVFKEIATMADRINLPKTIVDRANYLFKQVHDTQKLRRRPHDILASACLYLACREEGVPRTFKEISAIGNVNMKKISRCYMTLRELLDTNVDIIKSDDFMSRFCSKLGISHLIQRAATHIARQAEEMDVAAGKSPISIAAAAIYMASQASREKKNLKEIADVTGVAATTIKTSYKLLLEKASDLFPENFKFATPLNQLPK